MEQNIKLGYTHTYEITWFWHDQKKENLTNSILLKLRNSIVQKTLIKFENASHKDYM